jgi:hypothetical protein
MRFVALISLFLFSLNAQASIFGEETAVLLQVVANQLTELQRLAENVGIAKSQIELLYQINEGVQKATSQIQALQSIMERAQGVDPSSVRDLSDLNRTIEEMNTMSSQIHDLVAVKLILCDQAVDEAGLQSDTAYKMGQELIKTGAELAKESEFASPGRAQQITASSSAAQMLAAGVELQTLAQMSQLLALSLDLQKTQLQREMKGNLERKSYFHAALSGKREDWIKNPQSKLKPKRKEKK